jgi:ATP-dependent RNA helicase DeaD
VNTSEAPPSARFSDLGLSDPVMQAIAAVGYEVPTPIQAATIPALLAGTDVLGQAQTGTGKTAAFALPILSRLDLTQRAPQALVLVPTRELAIQVAEAFQKYATHLRGFHVLPIYGGQSYTPQLTALKRGVHVIVGTPGRVMDHLDRGSLTFEGIRFIVLDEADEMLAMGFVDAMDTILGKAPAERQVALFSATMAAPIHRIAKRHLREPREITIRGRTTTAANINQRYWLVSGLHKLDALTRILEVMPFDGMLVFARTKLATTELAERLGARGFAAAALNGDMQQSERERTVAMLKSGQIDILVATDVAARGLDVERISHVVNYDVPHDTESYIHRIGRTGRAGRSGEAILFIASRERNMLRLIERATRQPIEQMDLPSIADVNATRVDKFKRRVAAVLERGVPDVYRGVVEELVRDTGAQLADIGAALASLAQGKSPLLMGEAEAARSNETEHRSASKHHSKHEPRHEPRQERESRATSAGNTSAPRPRSGRFAPQDTYRLEVGRVHGVQAGNIVGAIANEAGLDGAEINGLKVREDHSVVRLPAGMPEDVLQRLAAVRVRGRPLAIIRLQGPRTKRERPGKRPRNEG